MIRPRMLTRVAAASGIVASAFTHGCADAEPGAEADTGGQGAGGEVGGPGVGPTGHGPTSGVDEPTK